MTSLFIAEKLKNVYFSKEKIMKVLQPTENELNLKNPNKK